MARKKKQNKKKNKKKYKINKLQKPPNNINIGKI